MFYIRDVLYFALFFALTIWSSRAVWRRTPSLSRLETWAIVCGATAGLSGLLIWILGSTVGVGIGLTLCLFVVPIACFVWSKRTTSTRCVVERATLTSRWRELAWDEKLLALYTILVCGLTFLISLAPPSGADYDSLVYHLAAPAQYIRQGHIVELPFDHHTYFAFSLEMLYMVGLLWSGPVLAKLFHWLMLPIICATLIGSGSRYLSRRAGLASSAIWCSLPLVQLEASTAYIDLGLVAFTLLALTCFWRWRETFLETDVETSSTRSASYLILAGAFCGFCMGTKYLGVLTLVWIFSATILVMARARRFETKTVSSFVAIALLIGGGWYARNMVWTGNPVFPFAYSVFGGQGWTAEKAAGYEADQKSFGFGRAPLDVVLLPWRASMTPLNVGITPDNRVLGQPLWPLFPGAVDNGQNGLFDSPGLILSSFIGPLLLALGAPLLFLKNKPSWIRFLGWSTLILSVVWFFTSQQLRFALPMFALLCAACGWGLEVYSHRSRSLQSTVALGVGAWLVFAVVLVNFQARRTWDVVFARTVPNDYLTRTFAGYAAMNRASRDLPLNARVAVYGEPRTFYLQRDYFWADEPHNLLVKRPLKNSAQWLSEMRRLGTTHVLVNENPAGNGGFGGPPPQFNEAVAQGLVRPLFAENDFTLYVL